MKRTVNITLTLDELDLNRARLVLSENGLTLEHLLETVLERTAREGAVPLKKRASRPKKKPSANMPGLFVQGDLFETPLPDATDDRLDSGDTEEIDERPVPDTELHPTLPTIASLQEAQAMLHWRERERLANPDGGLKPAPDGEKTLIETRQFRLDKVLIAQSPMKPAIIAALEVLFTDLSRGITPADALVTDDGKSWYVPLTVLGIDNGTLGLIYEPGPADVCMVRYGKPADLLRNPPVIDLL